MFVYFERERERENELGRGRERGRERTPRGLHAVSTEPDEGLELGTLRSRPESKPSVGCLTTEPPRRACRAFKSPDIWVPAPRF